MKKIVFVVAATLLAFGAQAAAVNWTANNVYAGDGTSGKGSGYVGYLFLVSDYTAAQVSAAIDGGNWSTVSGKALAEQYTNTSGKYTGAATASAVADALGGTSQTAFAVIFNADSVDSATKYYITPTKDMTINGVGTTVFALGSQAASQTASWGTVPGGSGDIPEPTSGLLLLVGAGMLALRRKQK